MKVNIFKLLVLVCLLEGAFFATPSSEFWSYCVMDIQPFGITHLVIDNYETVLQKGVTSGGSAFPTDIGLEIGVLPFDKLQMEVGVDLNEPTDAPFSFNGKIGLVENTVFNGAPGIDVGIFNVGTEPGVTDYDIVDVIAGRTLPFSLGRVHIAYYIGSNTLKGSDGTVNNSGLMFAFDKAISDKVSICGDYVTGKNAIGGGGIGLTYNFTTAISLLGGPVWFNDLGLNGSMKWSTQLNINL